MQQKNQIIWLFLIIGIFIVFINIFNQATPERVINLDSSFQLKTNEIAFIKNENLRIKFLDITEDSRCPSDVQCVWEGQATIVLNILRSNQNFGNAPDYSVDISLTSRAGYKDLAIKNFDGYLIKLIKIEPYPKTTQKIKLTDYIITLIITKT